VFERFTDHARRVVVMAQEEARLLNHNYIGTEHILLGILRLREGVACLALDSLGVSLDRIRFRVEERVGHGSSAPTGHIPFTPRAKKVLELSLREALQLGHNYIGTEHILLGLVREGEGVACQVLVEAGVELSRLRETVLQLLTGGGAAESVRSLRPVGQGPSFAAPRMAMCSFCGRDLWDVTYYVAGPDAAICEDCVGAARIRLEDAATRGAEPGALHLPPQVSGELPGDRAAASIVDAFTEVYGAATHAADMRHRPLEDVESLLPAIEEAGRRHPNMGPVSVAISRIRFRSDDVADVRFTLFRFPFEGQAIRDAGTWKVSRDTFCQTLARGGIQCPPRESS
jgi:hypothetical protein